MINIGGLLTVFAYILAGGMIIGLLLTVIIFTLIYEEDAKNTEELSE